MALAYVNLSSKQFFNFMCRTDFERRIFHDSYAEFQKKSKIYSHNQSINNFSQMCLINAKAKSLHQKLQYAVMNSIEGLENKMPQLFDMEGNSILFDLAELKIHTSDLLNKAAHVVYINYTSPKLVLHEILDDVLIVSYLHNIGGGSFAIKMAEDLIIEHKEVDELVYS
jgi:hypothetical protein